MNSNAQTFDVRWRDPLYKFAERTVRLLFVLKPSDFMLHYHLEVQANPPKIAQKMMLFLASMGEMGLSHDIFFKYYSLGPFEVVEVDVEF